MPSLAIYSHEGRQRVQAGTWAALRPSMSWRRSSSGPATPRPHGPKRRAGRSWYFAQRLEAW